MRGRLVVLLSVAALGIGACGEEEGGDAALEPAIPANVPTETTTTDAATTGKPFKLASIKVSKDTSKKPTITKPSGDPPTKLVTKDIVVGKGKAAKAGDQLEMHYLGALFDGKQFEASWDCGQAVSADARRGRRHPGLGPGHRGHEEGRPPAARHPARSRLRGRGGRATSRPTRR